MTHIVTYAHHYKPATKTMVVGKTDRLKLPRLSAELQARNGMQYTGLVPLSSMNTTNTCIS